MAQLRTIPPYRAQREKLGVSLRSLATTMGISAPYLSDVERGNRQFTPEMKVRHQAALTKAKVL